MVILLSLQAGWLQTRTFLPSLSIYVLLPFRIPAVAMPMPPTDKPSTIILPIPAVQMFTPIRKPLLPGEQESPLGLDVLKKTAPESGGNVGFEIIRSPPVNAIFQPFLPLRLGAVHCRTVPWVTVDCVYEIEARELAATVNADEALLSTTA